MASRNQSSRFRLGLSIMAGLAFLSPLVTGPAPALAMERAEDLPGLDSFTESLEDGQAGVLRGIYVPGGFAYHVVQQPVGNPAYISGVQDVVTQFSMAAEVGNVGLLAHNYLAGYAFSSLTPGREVILIYGNGNLENFIVTRVLRVQALQPLSPTSEFRDPEAGLTISADEMFNRVYRGGRHTTFQTCIEAEGNPSWGRLFVIAEPSADVSTDLLFYYTLNTVLSWVR
jgi:hypothetical protein